VGLISLCCILVRSNHNGKRRRRKPAFRPIPVGGRQKFCTADGEGHSGNVRGSWPETLRVCGGKQALLDRVLVKGD
jgi:hypothetical protein